METNPKSFRKEHLAIRNAMSEKEVAEKSGIIIKRLLQTGWYQNAQEIFAYYPLKNERWTAVHCFYRHGQMGKDCTSETRKKIRWIFTI